MILASDEEEDGGSLEFSHRLDANQRASIRCLSNRTWLVSCRMEWAIRGLSSSCREVKDGRGRWGGRGGLRCSQHPVEALLVVDCESVEPADELEGYYGLNVFGILLLTPIYNI